MKAIKESPRQNIKNLAVGGDAIKRKNSSPVILQSPKPAPILEDPKEVLANRKAHRDQERAAFKEFVKAKRNAGKVGQFMRRHK